MLSCAGPFLRYVDQLEAELRRAHRSIFGPLQLIPSMLNCGRTGVYAHRVKLKISAQELRRHHLPSDT